MLWFTLDTHWGHTNIINYSKRPFSSVEEMNERLIENWNANVEPEDTVWHLGDFVFFKYTEFKTLLSRLNGNINVVLGNHDKVITKNKKDLLDLGLLKSVQDYKELKIKAPNSDQQMIILFHYGMRTWNKAHHGSWMCYGHSHGSLPPFAKSVDIGVDSKEITSEYRPISYDELSSYMSSRKFEAVDHHVEK